MDRASRFISGNFEEEEKEVSRADRFISGDYPVQREYTEQRAIDVRTSKPVVKWTPTGQKSTGMGTLVKAGFVDDPQSKINIFAKARGISPDRYAIHNGEIIYQADDGNWYPETKKTFGGKAKRFIGGVAAHTPSIVMGTLGAAAGPGTAALGAAGGEGIRRSIGALAFDEPQTATANIKKMLTEGALESAGYGAGKLTGKLIKRAGAKKGGRLAAAAGRDLPKIDMAKAEAVRLKAKKYGIDLLPPQTTESQQLINKFTLLGDLESSADFIAKAKRLQTEQVDDAVYRFLDDIAPSTTTPFGSGKKVVKASADSIEAMKEARRIAVKPLYKAAFKGNPTVDIKPVLESVESLSKELPESGHTVKAVNRVKQMLFRKIKDPDTGKVIISPEDRINVLDNVKKEIDLMLTGPESASIQKDVKRRLGTIKTSLVEAIDKVSPEYKLARKEFEKMSVPIEQVEKGIVGQISKLESDKVVVASKRLFASVWSSPEATKKAKTLIQSKNPEAWDEAIKTYITDTFEGIKGTGTPNLGARLYKKLYQDPRQRKILKAAMSPAQYENLENFTEVLRRSGLIYGKESATATRQVSLEGMKAAGQSKMLMAATRPLYTFQRLMGDRVNEAMFGKYQRNLAEAMMSEKAAKQLKNMKQLSPKSEKLLKQMGVFMSLVVSGGYQN